MEKLRVEKEEWQNAMGILQKTFLLTRAMEHFLKGVALIGAFNTRW